MRWNICAVNLSSSLHKCCSEKPWHHGEKPPSLAIENLEKSLRPPSLPSGGNDVNLVKKNYAQS